MLKTPQKTVALKGFLKRGEILLNVPEKGTASSRAMVQRQRPDVMKVPMQQQMMGTKIRKRRPIVPALVVVACL